MITTDGNRNNMVSCSNSRNASSRLASAAVSGNRPGSIEKYKQGTILTVGIRRIEILKYLTEGGFAQIYTVRFIEYLNEFDNDDAENDNNSRNLKIGDVACLKRVLVPDENGLSEMRNEVDVMKKLVNCPNIVQYYDSNASKIKDNSNIDTTNNNDNNKNTDLGFEILLLMEYCPNKSLLDFMNQRLTTKLTENEILKAMTDITTAVLQMHYLAQPLIHRDIKIENVLVDSNNNFKLADFGSTTKIQPPITTHQDIAILNKDIYMNTTPQYRSPEMIDLYKCLPIDEKSDIWALGVLLYKLLFYTTPFELTGQFAILHSKYEFPANNYSSKFINLIIIMLAENPNLRPNIFQVLYYLKSISNTMNSNNNEVQNTQVQFPDKYEQGPYNFEVYTKFQTNLTNLNNTMNSIQLKKFENNGKLDVNDNILLNKIYNSTFEVSTKLPLESSTETSRINNSLYQELASPNGIYMERISSAISNDERLFNNSSSTSNLSGAKIDEPPSNVAVNNIYLPVTAQRQKSQSSFSSNGGKSSRSIPKSDYVSEEFLANEKNTKSDNFTKQYKSNNPFPQLKQNNNDSNLNHGSQQMFIDADYIPSNVDAQTTKNNNIPNAQQKNISLNTRVQQQPMNIISPQFNNKQIFDFNTPFSPNVPVQRKGQNIASNQVEQNPIPNMLGSYSYSNNQQPFYNTSSVAASLQPQIDEDPREISDKALKAKSQSTVTPPIPPPPRPKAHKIIDTPRIEEEKNVYLRAKKETHNSHQPTNSTSPKFRKPSRNDLELTLNELHLTGETNSIDTPTSENTRHYDFEDSILSSESIDINLEDTKKKKTRQIFNTDQLRGLEEHGKANEHHQSKNLTKKYHSSDSKNKIDSSKENHNVSHNNSSTNLAVPEKKVGRRSLDLKYQEVHFSSPDLSGASRKKNAGQSQHNHFPVYEGNKKIHKSIYNERQMDNQHSSTYNKPNSSYANSQMRSYNQQSNNSNNNTSLARSNTRANHDLERYKEKSSNQSNSSISLGDVKNSFSRARQSLDLERMRRDNFQKTTESGSKRRSFFSSVFSKK
ncbi:hypothetical protein TPHA_0A04030 [Tetrapisispora phaffii CBS 4417]|uniref:Protein kinase domain-containing protein n=1 Tax=Tetrapisispora phaffii (strain ATCC 24235 / CBS 4417 / NBRC 1672 / NRRL Y-8282 / UCD 70-5) TaxID=1071381 RepID=G8BNK1_TETPH|nr:hypothetical protein TPHA_0A04030 [Tetrapisispora phaffii CBS 4417]CCE61479.1 hypothetical protein TPHA_0A04030 [Tetrapisispora phaffii CBS 4417]